MLMGRRMIDVAQEGMGELEWSMKKRGASGREPLAFQLGSGEGDTYGHGAQWLYP